MEQENRFAIVIDAVDKPKCFGNLKQSCDGQCKHYEGCVKETIDQDCRAGRD